MNSKLKNAYLLVLILLFSGMQTAHSKEIQKVFNITKYGAKGDGKTLDTKAIQKAIDAAAKEGNEARVLIPTGHKYLVSTIFLKSGIDFHLEGNAELIVSTNQNDYSDEACIITQNTHDIAISGTGSIDGRAKEFMKYYNEAKEIWIPNEWRPKLFILTQCTNLKITNITIKKAPIWTIHMMGCENVLIDGIKIKNDLDVPNCDGIDPDHCRNVEIRNCEISCGDDAIVVKTTIEGANFGPSANIWVHDCILETQDSGLKIGTETTQDIYNIVFERCDIKSSCRGLTIQLRDEGSVYNVIFRNINFVAKQHSSPWWGIGEAISLTAIPRNPQSKIGTIHHILIENVKGTAENSIRINGTKESRISDIHLNNMDVTLNKWTDYPGNLFDNRPTKAYQGIEPHDTPGISVRFADHITIENTTIHWGKNIPDYFTNAIQAHDVTTLELLNFKAQSAHPEKFKAIDIVTTDNK